MDLFYNFFCYSYFLFVSLGKYKKNMKLINLAFFLCIGITLFCILAKIEWSLYRAVMCYTPVLAVVIYNQYKYGKFTKPKYQPNTVDESNNDLLYTPFNIEIVKGDITKLGFDVVVNAANENLLRGGGVCGSIYKAAEVDGVDCLSVWRDNTALPVKVEVGECVVSPGFNCAKHIIHAVGPIYSEYTPEEAEWLLDTTYLNAFAATTVLEGCKTLAFPLISTGIYGYPLEEGIKVALKALYYCQNVYKKAGSLETVTIVCFSQQDYDLTVAANEKIKLVD